MNYLHRSYPSCNFPWCWAFVTPSLTWRSICPWHSQRSFGGSNAEYHHTCYTGVTHHLYCLILVSCNSNISCSDHGGCTKPSGNAVLSNVLYRWAEHNSIRGSEITRIRIIDNGNEVRNIFDCSAHHYASKSSRFMWRIVMKNASLFLPFPVKALKIILIYTSPHEVIGEGTCCHSSLRDLC